MDAIFDGLDFAMGSAMQSMRDQMEGDFRAVFRKALLEESKEKLVWAYYKFNSLRGIDPRRMVASLEAKIMLILYLGCRDAKTQKKLQKIVESLESKKDYSQRVLDSINGQIRVIEETVKSTSLSLVIRKNPMPNRVFTGMAMSLYLTRFRSIGVRDETIRLLAEIIMTGMNTLKEYPNAADDAWTEITRNSSFQDITEKRKRLLKSKKQRVLLYRFKNMQTEKDEFQELTQTSNDSKDTSRNLFIWIVPIVLIGILLVTIMNNPFQLALLLLILAYSYVFQSRMMESAISFMIKKS